MTDIDRTSVAEVVVDALRYSSSVVDYVPVFLKEKNKRVMIKAISLDMRRRLPEATRYAAFLAIARLSEFASEAAEAFQEERTTALPKPKSHVDYTMRCIWGDFSKATLEEYQKTQAWQPLTWNPFVELNAALHALAAYVGDKHFGIEIEEDDEGEEEDLDEDEDADEVTRAMELLEYVDEDEDKEERRNSRRRRGDRKRKEDNSSRRRRRRRSR